MVGDVSPFVIIRRVPRRTLLRALFPAGFCEWPMEVPPRLELSTLYRSADRAQESRAQYNTVVQYDRMLGY